MMCNRPYEPPHAHDMGPTEAELGPDWHRREFSSSALGTFDLFWKGVAVTDGISLGARTEAALRATLAEVGITPDEDDLNLNAPGDE